MPTVYRRRNADGTKAEIFTADIWIGGRKFPRSTGRTTRREAEKRAVEIEAELRAELARRHEPLTLDTLMGKYWKLHAADLPSASDVKYHIARILEILDKDKPLAELSNADVSHYVATRKKQYARTRGTGTEPRTDTGLRPGQATKQGFYVRKSGVRIRMPARELVSAPVREKKPDRLVSSATINRELDVLQAAYIKARDSWEHPVRPINWGDHRLEKPDKKNRGMSVEEARHAVAIARTRSTDLADAIELSYYTGMRQNELETLTPKRVNLAERYAVVLAKRKARQDHRERIVFLSTAAVALLSERIKPGMDPDAPLFVLKNARKVWEWVRAQMGRPDARWHDWRHTTGSLLGKYTKDPLVVKKQLGHTSINTSMIYIHTADQQVLEGVEAIPTLTERKVTKLLPAPKPEAKNEAEPPSQATIIDRSSERKAQ
jgi:integrase